MLAHQQALGALDQLALIQRFTGLLQLILQLLQTLGLIVQGVQQRAINLTTRRLTGQRLQVGGLHVVQPGRALPCVPVKLIKLAQQPALVIQIGLGLAGLLRTQLL